MRHVVQTTSGKIFCIAAEIAAANGRSTVRPAGNVLVPEPAKDSGEVQRETDGKRLGRRSGDRVDTPEKTEDESDEEEGEGEEWLGKEDGFVSAIPNSDFPFVHLFPLQTCLQSWDVLLAPEEFTKFKNQFS